MKKLLVLWLAAALLTAAGCGRQEQPQEHTQNFSQQGKHRHDCRALQQDAGASHITHKQTPPRMGCCMCMKVFTKSYLQKGGSSCIMGTEL